MPGIAQEGTGIRQHTDKVPQQTQVCQNRHLFLHTGLVVIEPPGRAVLHLAGNRAVLEASDNSTQLGIVRRIQRIQNGLGGYTGFIQHRQQLGNIAAASILRNGIHTSIWSLPLVNAVIVIPQAGIVKLHSNIQAVILLA